MAAPPKTVWTAAEIAEHDAQLKVDPHTSELLAKYSAPASDDAVERTIAKLKEKKFDAHAFDTPEAACDFLATLVKDGDEFGAGGSMTLTQIGLWDAFAKKLPKAVNLKQLSNEARGAGDPAKSAQLAAKGLVAKTFFSSCSAISEEGDLYTTDLSGTRIAGWLTAGRAIIVAGSNKVVKDEAAAWARMKDYQWALESARMRATTPLPGSMMNNQLVIRADNPFAPRITVVIVKGSYGF
ncbi:hypothetical protein DFJ74DRAFT_649980 [Hyaloraphidium curvatum]|nr:hypothetical protein DFJ74DRAFT_649980 [Hyaloraphidium curvatum]